MVLDAATLANYNAQIDASNAAGNWDRSWQLAAQRDAWITGQGLEPEAPKSSPHEALLLVAAGVPVKATPGNMLETMLADKTPQEALKQFEQPHAPMAPGADLVDAFGAITGSVSRQSLVIVGVAAAVLVLFLVLAAQSSARKSGGKYGTK